MYGKWNFERSYIIMGSILIKILNSGGIGDAISVVTGMIVSAFGGKIPEKVIFAAGFVRAAFIGILGYKYIKLVSTVTFGVVGYAIGLTVFRMVEQRFALNLPGFVDYLAGIAMLVLLGYLAYRKFAYALFIMVGALGFLIAYFIHPSYLLGAICAVVVAMITMNFVRYGFITILSICAGFLSVGMVSGIFPSIKWFSLTQGIVGKLLALVIAFAFIVVQLRLSHVAGSSSKRGSHSGAKRVKVRRVFDIW
jgi:hypothetical protein